MKEKCKDCPVPEIMREIVASRHGLLKVNAKAHISKSLVEVASFQKEAEINRDSLERATVILNAFVSSGKKCQDCKFL